MRQAVWLRSDLRVFDNSALYHALEQGPTLALYVISPAQWAHHDDAAIKIDFQLRNVEALAKRLEQLNVPLLVLECAWWEDLPALLVEFCRHWQISRLHVNTEYGVNEQRRDEQCAAALGAQGISVRHYGDATLLPPGSVQTQQQQMFQVFGAFKKVCWQRLQQAPLNCLPEPIAQAPTGIQSQLQAIKAHLANNDAWCRLWPAGEAHAWQLLGQFCQEKIHQYQETRDFPALEGTSTLSPWLTCGVLSVRSCWHHALLTNHGEMDSGSVGVVTWLTELLWREFYQHLLALHPRLSRGEPFKALGHKVPWRSSEQDLQAWQQGQTGFPLIDAAMRQLAATGWMHNRLRMVVAMFFSKNLLLPWQLGERWFMRHLVDGDLAANNGGWQWCASTGTDAVPYFRIFNPITQSQRFDPQGDFIRQWVPELAHVDNKHIHLPVTGADMFAPIYPAPIVEIKSSRARALAAFKAAGENV